MWFANAIRECLDLDPIYDGRRQREQPMERRVISRFYRCYEWPTTRKPNRHP